MSAQWNTLVAAVKAGANIHAIDILHAIRNGSYSAENALKTYLTKGWNWALPETRFNFSLEQADRIAREFSRLLSRRGELDFFQMNSLIRNAKDKNANDFCDANMLINEAYLNVMGVELVDLIGDDTHAAFAMTVWQMAIDEKYYYTHVLETEHGELLYVFWREQMDGLVERYGGRFIKNQAVISRD